MKNLASEFILGSSILFLLLLWGCEKDNLLDNVPPVINTTNLIEGLNVTIQGNISDADGSITKVMVDWGDTKTATLQSASFTNLQEKHTYSAPKTYTIKITAFDNSGDSTFIVTDVAVDYPETSLSAIKSTLSKNSATEFLILTLNLHTYQETNQLAKFNMIADVIGKMDVDFVAFQECAQNKSTAIENGIIRKDNAALIICQILKSKYNVDYNFTWGWSHYGWDIWEEGVAVLSKHTKIDSEDRYISTSTTTSNITSRKAIYGSYETASGIFNIFSAHTHWRLSTTDAEQNSQINKLKAMATEKELITPAATTFICGDFNGNPTSDYPWSEGYYTMVANGDYIDSFLQIYPLANSKPAQAVYNSIEGSLPGRIDYIYMKNNAKFTIVESQFLFKADVVGQVSDHCGVLTKVRYAL